MITRFLRPSILTLVLGCLCGSVGHAQGPAAPKITSPRAMLGFDIGADYHMINYTQITALWQKWASESNRMKLLSIGNSAEGRPQYMAIISSPTNLAKLEQYRDLSKKMAMGAVDEATASKLAIEGKAVVWIDGGMHSAESEHSQSLSEWVYQMISLNDPETLRFLDDVILLAANANPDGVELIANWYMRNPVETERTFVGVPRMYQKYVGHDNNRDFFMSSMPETINMNRILYREWFPQIMYNHHQTGPEGQVVFIPPFRDPFNYNLDPLVPIGIERVAIAIHERLISHNMPGSAMRSAANYSTWWNGGGRTTPYFHNQIGILTEIIGGPNPSAIPLAPIKQLPQGDWPLPARPQTWHYRQSVDYSIQMNRAVMDYASRNRELLLGNVYRMARNSIDRGSRDNWTITPKRITALAAAAEAAEPGRKVELVNNGVMNAGGIMGTTTVPARLYDTVLNDPAVRDPRGYIIPSDQPDFPTAVKFIDALMKNGVAIQRATAAFTVEGKNYPAGSYVVKTAQAYRPFVMDMFEAQDHPNDFAYPGGPPIPPYDIAGWTLAKQMGVQYDSPRNGFDGPFANVTSYLEAPPVAQVTGPANAVGYLVSHKENDAIVLTNRLLKAGAEVYWLKDEKTVNGVALGTGTLYVPASAAAKPILEGAAHDLGVAAYGVAQKPSGEAYKLKPVRIGLLDLYGGLMPSGWLRWILEQYEFNFEMIYPQVLDAGNLRANFDVLVFPSQSFSPGARSSNAAMVQRAMTANFGVGMAGSGGASYSPPGDTIPEEFRSMLGSISENKTVPPLKTFVEEGGTIVALGSSAVVGQSMGLPVKNHLTEKNAEGKDVPLPATKLYIPGSILRAKFDNTDPVAYGMPSEGYIFFDSSPVFSPITDSSVKVNRLAWFEGKTPLYSGWALGQQYLDQGSVAADASIGRGKLVLLGLEATFRATTHGTFKLFFNSLYYGSAAQTTL